MHDIEDQIKNIHIRMQQLVKQYQQVTRDKGLLIKELENSKSVHAAMTEQLRQLNERLLITHSAQEKLEGDQKTIMEKTINEYLKTIDRCMAMLNKVKP